MITTKYTQNRGRDPRVVTISITVADKASLPSWRSVGAYLAAELVAVYGYGNAREASLAALPMVTPEASLDTPPFDKRFAPIRFTAGRFEILNDRRTYTAVQVAASLSLAVAVIVKIGGDADPDTPPPGRSGGEGGSR